MPVISMFYGVIVMMYFFDDKGIFTELREPSYFRSVRLAQRTGLWPGIALCRVASAGGLIGRDRDRTLRIRSYLRSRSLSSILASYDPLMPL